MVDFFIDRPILSSVLSIVIVLAGTIALIGLPIAQFPEITPPQIEVRATYPGASADIVEGTVATPIEQEVNGVEDMIYMSSQSSNDGSMVLTVTFQVGTDLDRAAVNIQNRVAIAQSKLPEEVVRGGITTKKKSSSLLMVVALRAKGGSYDEIFLSNYASINVLDQLKRIPGVGDATIFGARDYGMRIWLNPDRLTNLGLTVTDVSGAIREQNVQFAAGQVGQPPAPPGQEFQYSVTAKGRLSEVALARCNEKRLIWSLVGTHERSHSDGDVVAFGFQARHRGFEDQCCCSSRFLDREVVVLIEVVDCQYDVDYDAKRREGSFFARRVESLPTGPDEFRSRPAGHRAGRHAVDGEGRYEENPSHSLLLPMWRGSSYRVTGSVRCERALY